MKSKIFSIIVVGLLIVFGLAVSANFLSIRDILRGKVSDGDVEKNGSSDKTPNDGAEMIRVMTPHVGEEIVSPLRVTGLARGTWYFEASFSVKVVGADEKVLGIGVAQAQGNWMTDEFVPFLGEIYFDPVNEKIGFVIFEKDNPSGMPEKAASVRIPVMFTSVKADMTKGILQP